MPTDGEDYVRVYRVIVLYAGSGETCVQVYTIEDYLLEGKEEFAVYLEIDYSYYYPHNVYIDNGVTYIVIMDDESKLPDVTVVISYYPGNTHLHLCIL